VKYLHGYLAEAKMLTDKRFCVAVTTVVTLTAFVFFVRFLPDFVEWQGWEWCNPTECNVQTWLGSLSGWFGGFAAFITILFIMRQLREQKRQTDFAIGDAMPTLDAIEHLQDKAELVVRIVNWNPRAIVVRHIKVDDPTTTVMLNRLTINGKDKPVATISFSLQPFVIPGWEDRNGAPAHAEIRLAAIIENENNLNLSKSWHDLPRIVVDVQMLGDAHKAIALKADTGLLLR